MKLILIPFAILGIVVVFALLFAIAENNYHRRKRKKREKEQPNIHGKK